MSNPNKLCLIADWEYLQWLETGIEPDCTHHHHRSKNWALTACFGEGENRCADLVGPNHAVMRANYNWQVVGINCQRVAGNGLARLKPLPGMTRHS